MTKAIIYSLISILTFTVLGMIGILELHVGKQMISDDIDHVASYSENTEEHDGHESEIINPPDPSIDLAGDKSEKIISQQPSTKEADYKRKKKNPKHPSKYRDIIHKRAHAYSIDPSLVRALISVESNWNTKAISHRGAIGLMQLMPATAKAMGIIDPFNPTENIEGGIKYLSYLLEKFDGDITLSIAAYNAGPRRILKFRGIPPIKETQKYVERVMAIYNSDANPS